MKRAANGKYIKQDVCPYGHEMTVENTVFVKGVSKGCKACALKRQATWKASKRRERGILLKGSAMKCRHGHDYHITTKKKRCLTCENRLGKPRVRMTILEKRKQRVKWESKRRALKKKNFVEYVDPLALYMRDSGMCGICSLKVSIDEFEVDHIKPLSKGGEHSYANTQISHQKCNRKKWCHFEDNGAVEVVSYKKP
jgi:5-methylcytosine-specific restriction endonuclease McrA